MIILEILILGLSHFMFICGVAAFPFAESTLLKDYQLIQHGYPLFYRQIFLVIEIHC